MQPSLFMVLLGSKPAGRNTEQHDIFFGIGNELADLLPQMLAFWPETRGKMHIDAWREIRQVDGFTVTIEDRNLPSISDDGPPHKLFFINLGGYKPGEFEEFHYKMVVAAPDKGEAIKAAKATAFYKHTGFEGAVSHVDDKYGVDVDDVDDIEDILPADIRKQYKLLLRSGNATSADPLHLGYLTIEKLVAGKY